MDVETIESLKNYTEYVERTWKIQNFHKEQSLFSRLESKILKGAFNKNLYIFYDEMSYAYTHGMENSQLFNLKPSEWIDASKKLIELLIDQNSNLDKYLDQLMVNIYK